MASTLEEAFILSGKFDLVSCIREKQALEDRRVTLERQINAISGLFDEDSIIHSRTSAELKAQNDEYNSELNEIKSRLSEISNQLMNF